MPLNLPWHILNPRASNAEAVSGHAQHNVNHPGTNKFALSTSYLATSEPTEGSKRYQMLAEAKSTPGPR